MPNYDFKCEKCSETVEIFIPLAAYEEAREGIECLVDDGCKGCMMPVPAAPGVKFKGRGWTPKFGPR